MYYVNICRITPTILGRVLPHCSPPTCSDYITALKRKIPFKLWYGHIPDLSYLHEIGCWAFVIILNEHNPKIYKQSIECILLGYEAKFKTYQYYNPKSKQNYILYHVIFLESHEGHTCTMPSSLIAPTASISTPPAGEPSPQPLCQDDLDPIFPTAEQHLPTVPHTETPLPQLPDPLLGNSEYSDPKKCLDVW
jgi:hypothetical protein